MQRTFIYLLAVLGLASCQQHANEAFQLEIVTTTPIEEGDNFRDQLQTLAEPYYEASIDEERFYTPKTSVRRVGEEERLQVFDQVQSGFAGNPDNRKLATNQVQQAVSKVVFPAWLGTPLQTSTDSLAQAYNEFLSKSAADEILVLAETEGLLPQFQTFTRVDSLRQYIYQAIALENKRKILVLYKPLNPEQLEPEQQTFFAIREKHRARTTTKSEYNALDQEIEGRLKESPTDWGLWFERAVNRAAVNQRGVCIDYLRNAARYAIDQGSADQLLSEFRILEHTRFKRLMDRNPRHMEGILYGLEKEDRALVDVIPYVSYKSAKKGLLQLSLWINDEVYTNSEYQYRIAVYDKQNGQVDVALFLPTSNGDIPIRKRLQIGESISGTYGPNGEWYVRLINDSEADKNYARFLHRIVPQPALSILD